VGSDGDVYVEFGNLNNQRWCLNPDVLQKLSKFSIGQIVRVLDDDETLKAIRAQMGSLGAKVVQFVSYFISKPTKDAIIL